MFRPKFSIVEERALVACLTVGAEDRAGDELTGILEKQIVGRPMNSLSVAKLFLPSPNTYFYARDNPLLCGYL